MFRTIDTATWTDFLGVTRKVISRNRKRLERFRPLDRALIRFVFQSDHYVCQTCGAKWEHPNPDYDGSYLPVTNHSKKHTLVVDHIVSIRNGGSHHPNNLQTLCVGCNSIKAYKIDAVKGGDNA